MKIKKYKIPIYFGELYIISCKLSEVEKAISKLKIKTLAKDFNPIEYDAFAFSEMDKSGLSRYFIFIYRNSKPAMIAHECKHIVNFIFSDRGIKLDLHNDEPECYLLGWIVEKVHKFINK